MSGATEDGIDRIAFPIARDLAARTADALAALREDPASEEHVAGLIEVILELTELGMDFFYLEPLRRARAGTVTSSAARLGIAAAGRGIPAIVRRVVSSLDEEQLLEIADFVDEIMLRGAGPVPEPEEV